jgi:hypothetical protein
MTTLILCSGRKVSSSQSDTQPRLEVRLPIAYAPLPGLYTSDEDRSTLHIGSFGGNACGGENTTFFKTKRNGQGPGATYKRSVATTWSLDADRTIHPIARRAWTSATHVLRRPVADRAAGPSSPGLQSTLQRLSSELASLSTEDFHFYGNCSSRRE